uniref:Uncharacterized protein n=1 Tax=Mycena chlorophos TaxID=658473 RepID=A0ABQ0L0S0_MYCCL|nr:predicted protein [Mycena chlorophos]
MNVEEEDAHVDLSRSSFCCHLHFLGGEEARTQILTPWHELRPGYRQTQQCLVYHPHLQVQQDYGPTPFSKLASPLFPLIEFSFANENYEDFRPLRGVLLCS